MKIRIASCFLILFSCYTNAISRENVLMLCDRAVSLDVTLAMQSLQPPGETYSVLSQDLHTFRLTEEQVAPIIERYKKRPGDARLLVQYPPHADSYYLDNCMADPVRYIPNYEKLKAVYK